MQKYNKNLTLPQTLYVHLYVIAKSRLECGREENTIDASTHFVIVMIF